MKSKLKSGLLALLLPLMMLGTTSAKADIWEWMFNGSGVNASGTFETAGSATSFEAVSNLTGTLNGFSINGLVGLGLDPGFIYDNQFSSVGVPLSNGGLLMSVDGGVGNFNIYSIGNDMFGYAYSGNPFGANIGNGIQGTFEAHAMAAPVPEPETYAMLIAGLGLMGFVTHRRRRQQKHLDVGVSQTPAIA